MKKNLQILIIFMAFFHFSYGNGSKIQTIKGSNKNIPITINRIDISLMSKNDFIIDKNAKSKFVSSAKYSEADFIKVVELTKEQNFPDGITTPQKMLARESDFIKYKSFFQGSWLQVNTEFGIAETYYLLWIPKEDNLSMPADMIPKTDDGFYVILNQTGFDITLLPINKLPSEEFLKKMSTINSKSQSVKLIDPYNKLAPNHGSSMEFTYSSMVMFGGYNSEEFARIKELATEKNWPSIFTSKNRQQTTQELFESMTAYNCYLVTTFRDEVGLWDLIWIPLDENLHMPANMQPLTKEGFYVITKKDSRADEEKRFMIRGYSPSGRMGFSIAGKNPNAVKTEYTYAPTTAKEQSTASTTTSSNQSPPVYNSGNVSVSSFALDIFKELGSMAIYDGSVMYVVKVKGNMQDQAIVAAKASQVLGFSKALKYQWFPGNNCTTLKSKYSAVFTVICRGEVDLDK